MRARVLRAAGGYVGVMRPALRSLAMLAMVLVIYYAFPVGELPSTAGAVLSVVGLVVGVVVLGRLVLDQVRLQLRSDGDEGVQVQSLLVLVYATILLFSLGYAALAQATDDQFVGMETKTDALYFTMSTLATVGFGDVHAVGQLARGLVTAQIVFNLVFVGTLVTMVTGALRQRAASGRSSGS